MQESQTNSLTSLPDGVSHVVAPASATTEAKEKEAMTENQSRPRTNLEMAVEWSLQHDVECLTRLADGLEEDPNYGFNSIGELQGNGVELDTWCHKLGYARETLKTLRQAIAADEKETK